MTDNTGPPSRLDVQSNLLSLYDSVSFFSVLVSAALLLCHRFVSWSLVVRIVDLNIFYFFVLFTFDWVLEVFQLAGPLSTQLILMSSLWLSRLLFICLAFVVWRQSHIQFVSTVWHLVLIGFGDRTEEAAVELSWVDSMCGPISKYNIFCLYYSKCLHFVIGTSKCQVTLQKGSPICLPSILKNNHLRILIVYTIQHYYNSQTELTNFDLIDTRKIWHLL